MLKLFYSTSSAGGFFSPLAHKKKDGRKTRPSFFPWAVLITARPLFRQAAVGAHVQLDPDRIENPLGFVDFMGLRIHSHLHGV